MSLDSKTKFFYGMGFISVGIKDILYAVFVFFYFSQILGLDQIYTGTATLIAIYLMLFLIQLLAVFLIIINLKNGDEDILSC